MDERDWKKTYDILTVSRSDLRAFGLSIEQINQLTDEDMERIALELYHRYILNDFSEDVLFVARLILSEQHEGGST